MKLQPGAGPAHPEHVRRRARRQLQGPLLPGRGHRAVRSRTRSTWRPRCSAMECIVVQDIFLNETAKYAHVFLPGSSFLEKDGTFTNAERRISRVRKVMPPLAGYADWEATIMLSRRARLPDELHASVADHGRDRARSRRPSRASASRRSTNSAASSGRATSTRPSGTPTMHIDEFVRGKGRFVITKYVPTDEKVTRKFPLLLTTGPHPVAVQRRRADAAHGELALARGGPARDPSARRRGSRHQGRTTGSASSRARARPCCARRSPSACSRASSTRPSTSPSPAPT